MWVDGNCIEFVSTGCLTRKWLRFDQTIRNLTSGDLGILLVVIRLGVTRRKKTMAVYLLDLFQERGENEKFDLVRVECLQMIGLMVVMLMSYSRVVSVALVLWGVGPVLRNGHGIYGQKVYWSEQGDTPEINIRSWFLLDSHSATHIYGLVVSTAKFNCRGPMSIVRRAEYT